MISVSVIISVYSRDRLKDIKKCIRFLSEQTLLAKEILVVVDPDQDLINFYHENLRNDVKIVRSNGFGLSNARNSGIKASSGEIVAFIDDDAFPDNFWLENLVKPYCDSTVVSVGGFIKPNWPYSKPYWFPEELFWIIGCSYKGLPEKKSIVRNPIGCNMSFRKKIFEDVGYFRTDIGRFGKNLLGSEEPELCTRISTKYPELKIIYNPDAIVYHNVIPKRLKISYLWKRSFFEGFSKALLMSDAPKINDSFSTEDTFLNYLLTKAIPFRVKKFYHGIYAVQLLVLAFSTSSVFLGFLSGKLMR